MQGVNQLAVDVELKLGRGSISNAHRCSTAVAGQPRHLPLDELSFARQAIHDLELMRTSRHTAPEPLPPRLSLIAVARRYKRHQRKGRVSQPAIAVIPIAFPAKLFRQ